MSGSVIDVKGAVKVLRASPLGYDPRPCLCRSYFDLVSEAQREASLMLVIPTMTYPYLMSTLVLLTPHLSFWIHAGLVHC